MNNNLIKKKKKKTYIDSIYIFVILYLGLDFGAISSVEVLFLFIKFPLIKLSPLTIGIYLFQEKQILSKITKKLQTFLENIY